MLEAEIQRYTAIGYRVVTRTPTSAQVVRQKTFSVPAAIIFAMCLLVGLLIYLLVYAAQRDDSVYLSVDERGRVQVQASGGRAGWICADCGYENRASRTICKRCRQAPAFHHSSENPWPNA